MSNIIKNKKYFRVKEFTQEIYDSQHETFSKGWSCGWDIGDDIISFKEGHSTYIYAHPGEGKTVFITESLVHLARNEKKVVCIYSPETGKRKDIVWTLIQVYAGKRLYGKNAYKITREEIDEAINFIDEWFVILEHDSLADKSDPKFTAKDIFNQVHSAQKEYNKKINVLCIDPFNFLDKELEDERKTIQDYVLDVLKFINAATAKMKLHTMLIAHLRDEPLITDKDTGVEYMPKPFPSKLGGGTSFWRAGYQMIGLWREPFGLIDKTGMPYNESCTQVICQKSKPLGIGKKETFKLFFNEDTHSLYEKFGDYTYKCGEKAKEFENTINKYNMPPMPTSSWHEQKSPLKDKEELDSPF